MHGTMSAAKLDALRDRASSLPLEQFDPGDPELFRTDTFWAYFDRLRREDPVHYCKDSMFGPYWSVTRYNDIMEIETNHSVFSSASALGGITIRDIDPDLRRESFISMDPPRHAAQRKTVAPMFTPTHLDNLALNIRKRSAECLDNLPRGEVFDWVDRVSIELTTQMLAVLFDFPWEDRRKLTRWSDIATTIPGPDGLVATEDERMAELTECAAYFSRLWKERSEQPPKSDLLSMMAHGAATRDMDAKNFLGNLILLIVGGNDTTRNTMSGSLLALSQHPEQYRKLRENPALLDSFVPEVIRWQTPLAHMRRTALSDFEFRGKQIKKGDKVVMWYVSGNRDEEAIEKPYDFIIDRARPRTHLSFGFGIHRCVGLRLAELQLKIIWEEILGRFDHIDVVGEPKRVYSSFVKGLEELPVKIAA
ncbi:cytochrome P450 [Bradyrhizobium sp. WBOS7]|uniref:Cytochrome P450 n=1 Tax=Bradyrhizobium betae TaxID=244734 RepID=A0AAE9N7P1_9BRAD|nr:MULTISPECIES: cytochrome P450 [Bradyrhizobium]MDD1574923.1 cytochrome P450 [Bradyrhizobium sp. WBOS1]UUO33334.1 cytochrome P450 [Bradyrhizobium sp. WBOS01]MDD1531597.1 cytochrome P450 [Bradyrhizobium sp. WBOS2]MDD1581127.1 cytochrome P450 [Bradyrhizobium sp. WBOS7]MDD1604771.1 cytochrome P450 [Bradyrhizobium sp. WBOS16]